MNAATEGPNLVDEDKVTQHYERGNRFYKEGRLEQAFEQYSLGALIPSSQSSSSSSSSMYFKLISNRSICAMQLRDYEQALRDLNACLHIDNHNTKALMRRCKVYEVRGDYVKALSDCKAVLNVAQSINSVPLFSEMMQTSRRLEQSIEKDKLVRELEGVPARFCHGGQALRLAFMEQPPCIVKADISYSIRVSVTNEFGLWQRQLFYTNQENDEMECPSSLRQSCTYITCDAECVSKKGSSVDAFTFYCGKTPLGVDGKGELYFRFERKKSIDFNDDLSTLTSVYILKLSCDTLPSGCDACDLFSLPMLVSLDANSNENDPKSALVTHECMSIGESIGAACIRSVDFNKKCVYVLESPGYLGIGGKIWDSTYVLLNYLGRASSKYLIEGKKLIELGSGTGIAGIAVASLRPSKLILTDLPEVVPLIEENIRLNRMLIAKASGEEPLMGMGCDVEACAYSWGSTTFPCHDGIMIEYDTIVASDVIYDPLGYQPLYDSLCHLLHVNKNNHDDAHLKIDSRRPILVLAHRHRHPEDHKFFDMLYNNEKIIVEKIDWRDGVTSCALLSPDILLFHIYCNSEVTNISTDLIHGKSTDTTAWTGFADYMESMGTKLNGGGMNANFDAMLEIELAKEKEKEKQFVSDS